MKIEIVNVTKGVWRFYVTAGNGRTLCRSVDYLSRRNARDGARTLVEKAGTADLAGGGVTAAGDLVAGLHAVHAREFPHRPQGMMRLSDDTLVACLYLLERVEQVRQELLARPGLRQADIDRLLRTSLRDPE